MIRLGKTVCRIPTTPVNPRNGEGSFLRLRDGSILFAYTQYYAGDANDHGTARIAACRSSDEGENWTEPFLLLAKDESAVNIMSPTLLRLKDGGLGMVYLRKGTTPDGGISCIPVFRRSEDEGASFSEDVPCMEADDYYCGTNDSVIRCRDGRILIPISLCCDGHRMYSGKCFLICSDDNGRTWKRLPPTVCAPFDDPTGLQEPGLYEFEDGRLWMWYRTGYGFQYQSFSEDGGLSWSPAVPNFHFTSPDSPMRVRRLGRYTAAVFNPIPYCCLREETESWDSPKRSPLVCAISTDDGRSFDSTGKAAAGGQLNAFAPMTFLLEANRKYSYCYPAIQETKDGFLVAYYISGEDGSCLNQTKISKVTFGELEAVLPVEKK